MRLPRRPWSPLLLGAFFLLMAGFNVRTSVFTLAVFSAAAGFGGSTNDAILLLVGFTCAALGVAYWATGWGLLARRVWARPFALGLAAWGATLALVFLAVRHNPGGQVVQLGVSAAAFFFLTRPSVTASFVPAARRWPGRLLAASSLVIVGFLWLIGLGGVMRLEKWRGKPRVARGGIRWQTDFDRAKTIAQEEGKPILVVCIAGGDPGDPC